MKINKNVLSQNLDMIEHSLTQTVYMNKQVSDTGSCEPLDKSKITVK